MEFCIDFLKLIEIKFESNLNCCLIYYLNEIEIKFFLKIEIFASYSSKIFNYANFILKNKYFNAYLSELNLSQQQKGS